MIFKEFFWWIHNQAIERVIYETLVFFHYLALIICPDIIEPINRMRFRRALAIIMSIFYNSLLNWLFSRSENNSSGM